MKDSNVINLVKNEPLQGAEATAKVVAWLREQADDLESGAARPVHKATLVLYEDRTETFRVGVYGCNATTLDKAGMLSMALSSVVDVD